MTSITNLPLREDLHTLPTPSVPIAPANVLFEDALPYLEGVTPTFTESTSDAARANPGQIWDSVLIRAGMSLNNRRYPEATLRAAAPLFNNCIACADHPTEDDIRNRGGGRSVREIVGYYTGVSYNEQHKAIEGQFNVLPNQTWLRDMLTEMSRPGVPRLVGLSINARGDAQNVTEGGQTFPEITRISTVESCDVVVRPAAGGGVLRLIADTGSPLDLTPVQNKPQEAQMNREQIRLMLEGRTPEERARWIVALGVTEAWLAEGVTNSPSTPTTPAAPASVQVAPTPAPTLVATMENTPVVPTTQTPVIPNPTPAPAATITVVENPVNTIPNPPTGTPSNPTPTIANPTSITTTPDPASVVREAEMVAMRREIEIVRREALGTYANTAVAAVNFPESVRNLLVARLTSLFERRTPDRAEIDYYIKESKDLWAAFEQSPGGSGSVSGLPGNTNAHSGIFMGEAGRDKMLKAIDGMLENKDVDKVPRFHSFKQAFCAYTGNDPYKVDPFRLMRESQSNYDHAIHGRVNESTGQAALYESLTTASWANVFSDRMNRRMVQAYSLQGLDDWRKLVSNIETITDFRSQRRERVGGYGTLPIVAEAQTYQYLTSPSDEEVSYAIKKRGGLDDITFEMIANDDLRQIRDLPVKLARAAAMTLFRFVMDMVKDTATAIYDGNPLYYAGHNNIVSGNPVLGDSGLATAWQQMRSQQPFGSTTEYLGMSAKPGILIVPNTLQQIAWRLQNSAVTILNANYNATEPNFFKGQFETIVVDYWTDPNDWVLLADPASIPTIEMGFFNGQELPELFVQDQPNVGSVMTADKITYKIRHIYSGVVLDWRGFAISQPT